MLLKQINSMSAGDSEGPAWNKFWMSMENGDTESLMSGEGGSHAPDTIDGRSATVPSDAPYRPGVDRLDSVLPTDSASHNGLESPEHSAFAGAIEEVPFTFKFKAPSGRVHRLQLAAAAGIAELVRIVGEKLGGEAEGLGGVPNVDDGRVGYSGFALSYMDNEGDTVAITTDHDLLEAITIARAARKDKVDLFVHDPEKPAIPVSLEAPPTVQALPTPPESSVRPRRRYEVDGEDADTDVEDYTRANQRRKDRKAAPSAKAQEASQIVQGVPNELLLPGAIAVLAGVIIVTFALGRATSR